MKALEKFIVIVVIIGYVACMGYSFYLTIKIPGPVEISMPLTYIMNGLCGLVGGIVASAFGVSLPDDSKDSPKRYKIKMNNLGKYLTFKKDIKEDSNTKTILGSIYAWAYILVGLFCIFLWLTDALPPEIIKNSATITLGLIIIIANNYFSTRE